MWFPCRPMVVMTVSQVCIAFSWRECVAICTWFSACLRCVSLPFSSSALSFLVFPPETETGGVARPSFGTRFLPSSFLVCSCVLSFCFLSLFCGGQVGDKFRDRARKFPGLISGCNMNWFFPWPTEALIGLQYVPGGGGVWNCISTVIDSILRTVCRCCHQYVARV